MSNPAPAALELQTDSIPASLKELPQWIVWRFEPRRKKDGTLDWTKVPYDAKQALRSKNTKAKSTDPDTWATYDDAVKAYELYQTRQRPLHGIGFNLERGGGLCCIDLDDALEAGKATPAAERVLAMLKPTYTEVSPSGTGLHVWLEGKKPGGRARKKLEGIEVEIYDGTNGRYLTVTGHQHGNTASITADQDGLNRVYELIDPPRPDKPRSTRQGSRPAGSSDQVERRWQAMLRSENGPKIQQLLEGELLHYESESEATGALVHHLRFWLDDPLEVDRAFRASGLMRDKWDEKRGDSTWGQNEIDSAFSKPGAYTPPPSLEDALTSLDDAEADPVEARHNVFQALMVSGLDAVDVTSQLKSLSQRIGSTFTAVQKAYREFVRDSKLRKQPRSTAGIYAIHNGALCRVEEAGTRDDVQEIYHPLGNFAAVITAEALKNDGQTVTRHFDIEVTTQAGRVLPVARVPAERFSAMQWVNEYGTDAIIYAGMGTRDHVRVAILTLSEPQRFEIRTHTGWDESDPDNPRYIHAGGAITMHGADGTTEVDLEGPLQHYVLETPESFEDARAAMRASLDQLRLAPAAVTAPLLASMYRAPLGAADFVPHVVGPTGAGKTQLAALALQHYGPSLTPDSGTLAWSSTANYIEAVLFHAKEAPVLTDDFNPTGNNVNAYYQAAERVIRSVGNQAGRGRMNADSSLRETKTPRGLMISTGEDLPRGHSLRARMLIAELEPGTTNWQAVTTAQQQAAAGLPARAMSGYIQWLAHGLSVKREAWREAYLEERAALQELAPHGRTADMGAQLLATLTLIQEYATVIEALPAAELTERITEARAGIISTVQAQADLQAAADPVDRFMTLLDSLMSSGAAHVANPDGTPPADAEEYGWRETDQGPHGLKLTPHGKRIGWLSGDDLWLDPQAAFSEAQALAVRQNDSIPMSQQTLWKRLAERGLLQAEVESGRTRYSIKKRRAGKYARVAVLPAYSSVRSGVSGAQPEKERAGQAELCPTPIKKVGHVWGTEHLKWGTETGTGIPCPTSEGPCPTKKTEWGTDNDFETASQTQTTPRAPHSPLPTGERAAAENNLRENTDDTLQPDPETGVLEL